MPRYDIDEGALLSASSSEGTVVARMLTPVDGKAAFYVFWSQNALLPGQVVIETAHDSTYAGSWQRLALFSVGANQVSRFQADGPFAAVRTRVLTALASGAVSTWVLTA